jgi:hypothetical protein
VRKCHQVPDYRLRRHDMALRSLGGDVSASASSRRWPMSRILSMSVRRQGLLVWTWFDPAHHSSIRSPQLLAGPRLSLPASLGATALASKLAEAPLIHFQQQRWMSSRRVSFTLTKYHPRRLAHVFTPGTSPHHPTSCPLSRRPPAFPSAGPGGGPLDSPMQCRTDEARDRFTSQHAHVVQGGVHLLRGGSEGVAESEAVKVPSSNGAG